jgi:hypothetical protein
MASPTANTAANNVIAFSAFLPQNEAPFPIGRIEQGGTGPSLFEEKRHVIFDIAPQESLLEEICLPSNIVSRTLRRWRATTFRVSATPLSASILHVDPETISAQREP